MSLHQKAEQYLRAKIESGEWQVGDCIPTEMELSEKLGVSRPTIRQAILKLTNAGHMVRVKGKGTFITQPKLLHESTSMLVGYRQESQQQSRQITTKVLSLTTIKPDADIIKSMGMPHGGKVVSLSRLRSVSGYNHDRPVVLTHVYVPLSTFPQMATLDFTQVSLYDSMESRGLGVRETEKTLDVVPATDEQASLLQLNPFEPLIRVTTIGKISDGTIIEYSRSYYPASSSQFLIRTTR